MYFSGFLGHVRCRHHFPSLVHHNFLHQVSHLLHTHIVSEGVRGLPWWTSGKESAF